MREIKAQSKLFAAAYSIILMLVTSSPVHADEPDVLKEAKLLLSNNEPLQAMQLLETHMDENAGIPAYDYLLGKAALISKKSNLAIFALERVSLSKPDFYNARFLLGKAYLNTGELEQASREFNLILRSNAQESLREASQRYLNTIESVKREASRSASLNFTLGLGYDSNANNATDAEQIGAYILTENSRASDSPILKTILSGGYQHTIDRRFKIHSNAQLFKHDYSKAPFVNTEGGVVSLGISHQTKVNKQTANVDYQHVKVNGEFNSKQLSSSISHYQTISNNFSMRGTLRGSQMWFREEYNNKDFLAANGGLQLFHFAKSKQNESITSSLSLIAGKEKPKLSTSLYGRNYAVANFGLFLGDKKGKNSINTNITYTYSDYDRKFLGVNRKDKNLSFSTQLNLKPVKKWTLGPQFRIMRTRSPIELFKYDKMQIMLLVSRQLV